MTLTFPDPLLRKRCDPVEPGGVACTAAIFKMEEVVKALDGKLAGLAAPQVGLSVRVIMVVDVGQKKHKTFINPVILDRAPALVDSVEGCLCLPGVKGVVQRPAWVVFEAVDPDGQTVRFLVGGYEAMAVQHEIDHLDGVLFIDRMTKADRREALKNLRTRPPLIELP